MMQQRIWPNLTVGNIVYCIGACFKNGMQLIQFFAFFEAVAGLRVDLSVQHYKQHNWFLLSQIAAKYGI